MEENQGHFVLLKLLIYFIREFYELFVWIAYRSYVPSVMEWGRMEVDQEGYKRSF